MPRKIHLTNAARRDATVVMGGLRPPDPPRPGLPDRAVRFVRYLAATEEGLDAHLQRAHGDDYGQALIDGDPEIDIEQVGRAVGKTDRVYLSANGDVMYAPPRVIEVIYAADGEEKERRDDPVDLEANVNEERPIVWTGRMLPVGDAVRRFVFGRTIQVRHQDGLTYDYLFEMARELSESGKMVMLGGGVGGRDPLIFQMNGTPYRGFLEGRVDGERYKLLLHLSNMELKRPTPEAPEPGDAQAGGDPA
jgi:hypothetical protein